MTYNKFWDIDDILMTQEVIASIAEDDIKGINFNNKPNGIGDFSDDVNITREGNKVESPIWFALVLRDNNFVAINAPKYLTDKFYNLLQADPTIINFKAKSNYIYDLFLKLIPYFDEEERKWPKMICDSIHKRFIYFMKNSTNVVFENYPLMKNMCHKEKQFYDKMVKINKNIKIFIDNYENNNKTLDEVSEIKTLARKSKKTKI
jgi:hypothetical protein